MPTAAASRDGSSASEGDEDLELSGAASEDAGGDEDDMLERMLQSHTAARKSPPGQKGGESSRADGADGIADVLGARLNLTPSEGEQVLCPSW